MEPWTCFIIPHASFIVPQTSSIILPCIVHDTFNTVDRSLGIAHQPSYVVYSALDTVHHASNVVNRTSYIIHRAADIVNHLLTVRHFTSQHCFVEQCAAVHCTTLRNTYQL